MRVLRIAMLAMAFVAGAGAAQAEDLKFTLINKTSSAITEFYVSHTGTSQWEENLMAGDKVDAGTEMDIVLADGRSTCKYDIKTVFADGTVDESMDVDACELGSWTFE